MLELVLVSTSLPANIGSAARDENHGFWKFVPGQAGIFPSHDAVALASGADDVLNRAVLENLADALEGASLVLQQRLGVVISLPVSTPKPLQDIKYDGKVAMFFGRETSGLSNEELRLCNRIINIPSNLIFFPKYCPSGSNMSV